MPNDFINRFEKYLIDWKHLDRFRLNWWLRYPLYLPFGFFLEMRNLNAKHRLTTEYGKYLDQLAEEKRSAHN